ncbi:hypothetical protein CGC54_03795 [Capnocytophaga canimorsus]|uniref:Sulfatase-modifying factor enzyme-like domain-containing protein n=1 Tax=Capnocytophaga canimorsus TaxID=28188 RepID=A0AAD0E9Y5_9FLAO|nr:SUMF1/EgtB/PvdO family nonheme iron enzyme [Capnocytophaga canimorsus]ATA93519.1 hypothetical protein CGC54_03795 [Capnocytophaga canimorsus]
MKKTTLPQLNTSIFVRLTTSKVVVTLIMSTFLLISCSKKDDSTPKESEKSEIKEEIPTKTEIAQPNNIKIAQEELIFVEGGTFDMGSPKGVGKAIEQPQHKVTLNSFKITKYEITNKQFAEFLTQKGNEQDQFGKWYQGSDIIQKGKTFEARQGKEKMPVVRVTWSGAKAFAQWAGGQLPTEAQWEYAAKGGKKSKGYIFSGSNDLNEVGWYNENSGGRMHNVGEKKPNELGIYDMSGNVWEFTADYWLRTYTTAPQTNPQQTTGKQYLRHGASAFCPKSACRVANRSTQTENTRHNMGFRVVFNVK